MRPKQAAQSCDGALLTAAVVEVTPLLQSSELGVNQKGVLLQSPVSLPQYEWCPSVSEHYARLLSFTQRGNEDSSTANLQLPPLTCLFSEFELVCVFYLSPTTSPLEPVTCGARQQPGGHPGEPGRIQQRRMQHRLCPCAAVSRRNGKKRKKKGEEKRRSVPRSRPRRLPGSVRRRTGAMSSSRVRKDKEIIGDYETQVKAGLLCRLQTQATYLAASTYPGSEEAVMKFSREIAPVLM
ncbi:hypothetical protein D4764_04G0007810 [Takifugu flavidus]|uniref:Uncharacterized protein n=1 Tax=Takifugu flavidus TaxID=433684 RepID=A0A5C6N3W1_9TELE|nr:hypothetical protein D4764_04G0007810 [Takifugu flavidus]